MSSSWLPSSSLTASITILYLSNSRISLRTLREFEYNTLYNTHIELNNYFLPIGSGASLEIFGEFSNVFNRSLTLISSFGSNLIISRSWTDLTIFIYKCDFIFSRYFDKNIFRLFKLLIIHASWEIYHLYI